MTPMETSTSQLTLFGRLADDLTRRVIRPPDVAVSLEDESRRAITKDDGYFAFADLPPSAADYRIRIDAHSYQLRTIVQAPSATPPAELTLAGEDELYLSITGVVPDQNNVTFEQIAYVPPIEKGAAVIGQNGFVATLKEPLEGPGVYLAVLSTVVALAGGQLLQIVRSRNLLVRPAPSYGFAADTTVLIVKAIEHDPPNATVGGAVVEISKINGNAPTVVDVGGLELFAFSVGGDPPVVVVLDGDDKKTLANDRGEAVFYFPGSKPVTSVTVLVSKPGHEDLTRTIDVSPKSRNFQIVELARR